MLSKGGILQFITPFLLTLFGNYALASIVPHIDWVSNPGHIVSRAMVQGLVARMHLGGWGFEQEAKTSKERLRHELASREELRLLHVQQRSNSLSPIEITQSCQSDSLR